MTNKADRLHTDEARAKSEAANTAAWADPVARAARIAAMKKNKKPKPAAPRAIGAIGPGDVQKLAAAGLTVVDTAAYEQLLEELDVLRAKQAQERAPDGPQHE